MIEQYLDTVLDTVIDAGKAILEVYSTNDFEVDFKSDQSPLTKADKAAHQCIVKGLMKTGLPILSEEGKEIPYDERKDWSYFWIVDPLDGTKEFVKRNGEFTVNVALIKRNKPIFGAVYAPVLDKLYFGGEGVTPKMVDSGISSELPIKRENKQGVIRIVASRSHLNDDTKTFLKEYPDADILSMGSSLKFMLLAEGKADIYPRFAPTMEWDTAAAHAIIETLGYTIHHYDDKQPLLYNKESLLNPYFLVN